MEALASEKQHAQQLLEYLAPDQIAAVVHVMEAMLDSHARKLAAIPLEDEDLSEEEEQALERVDEWRKHNKLISNDEVLAEFGLTPADFDRMGQTSLPSEPNTSAR